MYADQDTLCKANSLTFVGTRLETPVKDGSTIMVEPNKGNKSTVRAVYTWKKGNKIAVLNTTTEHVTLCKGTGIGHYIALKTMGRTEERETERISSISEERQKKLIEELKLDENIMLQSQPDIQKKVKDMIIKYSDVFSSPEQQIGLID